MEITRNTVFRRFLHHLFFILPLSIACILFAVEFVGPCDQSVIKNLYAKEYLLIFAGTNIFIIIMFFILSLFYAMNRAIYFARPLFVLVSDIDIIFNIIWLIMGALILFVDNRDCIQAVSTHVVFALIAWILSFARVLFCLIVYKVGSIGYSVYTNTYSLV